MAICRMTHVIIMIDKRKQIMTVCKIALGRMALSRQALRRMTLSRVTLNIRDCHGILMILLSVHCSTKRPTDTCLSAECRGAIAAW
jgi:hypothetical protein